jgi:N-acetylglucosaminyl-diphospho-decaprenol L-rhamnosyltransferase
MTRETNVPDISICIATWNAAETLRYCLRSIFEGEWCMTKQVIVTDNASEDGTSPMVQQEFPQVHLMRSETNLLYGGGVNLAARQATGRNLIVLNDDAFVSSHALETLCRFLDANRQAGICAPRMLRPSGKWERQGGFFPSARNEIVRLFGMRGLLRAKVQSDQPFEVDWVSGSCFAIRREIGQAAGFFDEGYPFYWEDVDLCYRVRAMGWSVWLLPQIQVVHAHAQSSRRMDEAQRAFLMRIGRERFISKTLSTSEQRIIRRLGNWVAARDLMLMSFFNLLTLGLSLRMRRKLLSAWYQLNFDRFKKDDKVIAATLRTTQEME